MERLSDIAWLTLLLYQTRGRWLMPLMIRVLSLLGQGTLGAFNAHVWHVVSTPAPLGQHPSTEPCFVDVSPIIIIIIITRVS